MNGPAISGLLLALVGALAFTGGRGPHGRSVRWIGAILILVGIALFIAAQFETPIVLLERLF